MKHKPHHEKPQKRKRTLNTPRTRRDHKDRLFCDLFSDKENALSLFNAVSGTDYTDLDALEIVTLKDVLYLTMHNDLAVCFHSMLGLFEQQSSVNPNMPLRGLFYFSREYEGWLARHEKDIYGRTLIQIPAPQYYILYNGTEEMPERFTYRLSDAFLLPAEGYEWTARVLNINPGKNPELLKQCAPLNGYVHLISLIRQGQAEGNSLEEAVKTAIDTCISQDILKDYLIKHKAEVTAMILTEYNEKLREKTLREEGWEDGLAQGLEQGLARGLKQGLEQGLEKGLEQGRSAMAEAIRKVMANMNLSADQAMEFLGIAEKDREQYRNLL